MSARRQIVEGAISKIQQTMILAVLALNRNLTCGNPGTEVRAAQVILEHSTKAVELWDLEQRVEELQRAEWYEKRAAIFRTGEEMPAAYRTPRESCAKVDELRKAICLVAGVFADLTIPEVVNFQHYLQDDTGARLEHLMTADQIKPTLEIFAVHLGTLLHLLGGQPGEPIHLWAYEVPLAESSDAV